METLKPYLITSSSLQCKDLSLQTYLPYPTAFPMQEHGPSSRLVVVVVIVVFPESVI